MINLPRCAICNRKVDKITVYKDHFHMELVFTAWCHGDKEIVRVRDEVLYKLRVHSKDIDISGVAFEPRTKLTTPRIELSIETK